MDQSEDPALRGAKINGFARKDVELFRGTGLLDYWSVGVATGIIFCCTSFSLTVTYYQRLIPHLS